MNELTFMVPGSIRSKKNHKQIYKGKGRIYFMPSDAYQRWQTEARLSLKAARINGLISTPVHVCAKFYYRGPKPDLQGAMESIADCLQGYVWTDDGLIESWDGSRLIHEKDNPRTVITVRW